MYRFLSRIAMRLAGWFAERLFDLACALDAMDNPTSQSEELAPPRKIPQSTRTPNGYHCSNCGTTPRLGACACGLPPGSAVRWSPGGVC